MNNILFWRTFKLWTQLEIACNFFAFDTTTYLENEMHFRATYSCVCMSLVFIIEDNEFFQTFFNDFSSRAWSINPLVISRKNIDIPQCSVDIFKIYISRFFLAKFREINSITENMFYVYSSILLQYTLWLFMIPIL